eukprot:gb/GECH01005198.1/.p1 GENE.gb/GECH01005198.1/~~gb/GECH01005198.1/.p1  ORF type:complete len:349 (+),score=91.13 gb/GECH01005198.1/:1-1047(+)
MRRFNFDSLLSLILFICILLNIVFPLCSAQCSFDTSEATSLTDFLSSLSSDTPRSITIPQGETIIAKEGNYELDTISVDGTLIFGNEDISMSVEWIRVNAGGALVIGDAIDECRITANITLTFRGPRTNDSPMGNEPVDGQSYGAKGLAIAAEASLDLHGNIASNRVMWTRLASTANRDETTITVQDSVDWKKGDKIVITSTDYGPIQDYRSDACNSQDSISWSCGIEFLDQNEERTITSISSDGQTLTLNQPLNWMHWGENNQRAEIGLLSRNIKLQGDNSSNESKFGGHLMIRQAHHCRISGVEFPRFGQKGIVGRYPVHFHLIGETFPREFYIREIDSLLDHASE